MQTKNSQLGNGSNFLQYYCKFYVKCVEAHTLTPSQYFQSPSYHQAWLLLHSSVFLYIRVLTTAHIEVKLSRALLQLKKQLWQSLTVFYFPYSSYVVW
jgi:hypothetical protein